MLFKKFVSVFMRFPFRLLHRRLAFLIHKADYKQFIIRKLNSIDAEEMSVNKLGDAISKTSPVLSIWSNCWNLISFLK